jgi:hypothetical protein
VFVAVGLAGLFCTLCIELRNRADEQDALIERLHETSVYVERWGPEWLEVVGAGRFRRRITGADVGFNCIESKMENNADTLRRLARLPGLQFLDLRAYRYRGPFSFTSDMAKEFDNFRQLRLLNLDLSNDNDGNQILTHAWMNGVAKLTRLERLRVVIRAESPSDLALLASSSNLTSLTLAIDGLGDQIDHEPGNDENAMASFSLAYLPILSNLEALDLHDVVLDGSTLGHLARFPRLRTLNLCWTSLADTDLSNLAPLQSLEELAIDDDTATATAFEVLISLQRLKVVHIAPSEYENDERSAAFALDDGHELAVVPAQVGRLRRALQALRNSNPGIAIDGGFHQFEEKGNFEPPWTRGDHGLDLFVQRWIKH